MLAICDAVVMQYINQNKEIKMRLDELIQSLTIEDAITYSALADKIQWIETELLDPNCIGRCNWPAVEDHLISILN